MSVGRETVPRAARWLLRLVLSGDAEIRALYDLEDVADRVAEVGGRGAARRAVLWEVTFIVLWAVGDGVRRRVERARAWRARGERRPVMLRDLLQDIRIGVRALSRRPGFSLIVVGVLGVGVGANVAIFTLADRLFLRDAPGVGSAGELVRLFRSWAAGMGGSMSYPDYLDYRDGATTLEGLAAASSSSQVVSIRAEGEPGSARLLLVSANWFDVLGVKPAAGRFFRAEENRTPGSHPVAVVSWGFWTNRLGGRDVVGNDVLLNGNRFTVVGVTPREYGGLTTSDAGVDVYIPVMMRNAVSPAGDVAWRERVPDMRERWLMVVGRMQPGVSFDAVQSDLARIAERIRGLGPEFADADETVLVSRDYRWYPSMRTSLAGLTRALLAAVALLLVIATANVAILLVARASARDREMGVRAALGAGRGRLARQLVTESLLLGLAGCVVGVAFSVIASRAAGALLPVRLDPAPAPNALALAFALLVSLVTALVVSLVPARRAARGDVVGLIQGRDARVGGTRVRDVLVVVQVALSLVLVAGSVLFARSFVAARSVDVGFDDRGVLLAGVNLRNHGYDVERGRAFVAAALERIGALPGVTLTSTTRQAPFRGDWTTLLAAWPGSSFADGRADLEVGMNVVSPGYFAGMGIPLLQGREFGAADRQGGAPVMIVNETFAMRVFGTADVLGRTVPMRPNVPPFTIIAVARDATYYRLGEDVFPQAYASFMQYYAPEVRFLVKTAGVAGTLVGSVQAALQAIDPDVAISSMETLEAVHAEQTARHRALAHVVGLSGLIALLLASAGLYGVMAYRVARRTREIGVRMALGATRSGVARDVVHGGLLLVGAGVALGLVASLAFGRLASNVLFGVPVKDPVSLVAAPLVLLAVAIVAMLVPARRAMRIDPTLAMRAE